MTRTASQKARAIAAARAQAEAEREAERSLRCPRPDKIAWGTREAAAAVIAVMRANGRPRVENLHPYECECGAWHVGDRVRHANKLAKSETP